MPSSLPSTPLPALNLSMSEPSMSTPDLTMSLSDPTTSLSWTSDVEGSGRQAPGAHLRHYKYKGGRKDPFTDLLGQKLGSEIALGGQAGDVHSMTSNFTSSHADTSSALQPFPIARSSRRDVRSPALAKSASLRDSLETSVESWASSGVPGFGYYSGKALKWLGERSLDAVDSVIILRRTYRHLARLKRWKKQGRTEMSPEQQQKLFTMLDDALEMSRPCYSSLVNKAAAVIARAVDDWILDHPAGPNPKETDAWLGQMHWSDDRRLARSHVHGARPPDELFWELLNAVTRVPLSLQDTETTSTVIRVLARELANSPYGTHHRWLSESLRRIVKQTQQTRPLTAEEMGALRNMATRRFERGELGIESCRPWEVVLFAECASQSPWCVDVVRGAWGLQSLVKSLGIAVAKPVIVFARDEEWVNIDDLLASLLSLSRHAWLESSFEDISGLIDLLLRVLRRGTRERRFRSCTCIIFTLRNLAAHQSAALRTPEATKALAALAAAQARRSTSSEEYYRKIVCGYARELLEDAGSSSMTPSGFTSEAEG